MSKPGKDFHTFNVAKLRKLARSIPNFPLQGRAVSKANREELITYLEEIFKE